MYAYAYVYMYIYMHIYIIDVNLLIDSINNGQHIVHFITILRLNILGPLEGARKQKEFITVIEKLLITYYKKVFLHNLYIHEYI
jgi:hypothetical protein